MYSRYYSFVRYMIYNFFFQSVDCLFVFLTVFAQQTFRISIMSTLSILPLVKCVFNIKSKNSVWLYILNIFYLFLKGLCFIFCSVNWSPRTAMTNYHKLGDLKTTEMNFLQFCRIEVWNWFQWAKIRVLAGPWEAGGHITPVLASVPVRLSSVCLCQIPLCLFYKDL